MAGRSSSSLENGNGNGSNGNHVPPLGALGHHAGTPEAWLKTWELDKKLGWREGAIRELVKDGTLRRGEHYVRKWDGPPLLYWPAIIGWLAEGD